MKTKTYKVYFSVTIPEDVSQKNVREWLEFELGANGKMSQKNPLCGIDLEANSFSVIID